MWWPEHLYYSVLGSRMGVEGILIYELFYCLINDDASDMELFHAEFIGTSIPLWYMDVSLKTWAN